MSSLTQEELRRKRLSALGQAKQPEVVDLLWSDDDDEPPKKVARAAAAEISTEDTTNQSLRFSLGTWNVWFGPQSGGNPHVPARMNELTRLLFEQDTSDHPLWFIGLQEVTKESKVPLQAALTRAGYQSIDQQNGASYGCLLAVRQQHGSSPILLDAGWIDYQATRLGRGFCYARVRVDNAQQVLIATTHLESWCGREYTGADQRPQQLREFESFLDGEMQTHPKLHYGILMGDLNYDDERRNAPDPPMDGVFTKLVCDDVWLQSIQGIQGRKPTCFTYDGRANPMLGNNLRRRFDRCLVLHRPDAAQIACSATRLLGTEALPGLTFDKFNPWKGESKTTPVAPSDHFGFVARVELGNQ